MAAWPGSPVAGGEHRPGRRAAVNLRHILAIPAGSLRIAIVSEESKRIARHWNREIEAEGRRGADRDAQDGPWKIVVWLVLWASWIALLLAFLYWLKLLRW